MLTLFLVFLGIWLFLSVGNSSSEYTSTERLQIHRNECIQRCHHVCLWCGCVRRDQRSTDIIICYHQLLHHLLYHNYALPRIWTKGNFLSVHYGTAHMYTEFKIKNIYVFLIEAFKHETKICCWIRL